MIRPALPNDVPVVLDMIRELAEYEREPDAVATSADDLYQGLFGPEPAASCHVATAEGDGDSGGPAEVVGFALWFTTFSTWTGRPGIYLEDLYVRSEHRRSGHGRALLRALADVCAARGYARLEWSVLDWNTHAQRFYRDLGAVPTEEWTRWRLDSSTIAALILDSRILDSSGTA
jgi:GNAT superfamily N-acetyltransferase